MFLKVPKFYTSFLRSFQFPPILLFFLIMADHLLKLVLTFCFNLDSPSISIIQLLFTNTCLQTTTSFMGASKLKWRSMKLDYSDDVMSSIALLHCLDVCYDSVETWFDRNLQLRTPNPSVVQCFSLFSSQKILENQFFRACHSEYLEVTEVEDDNSTIRGDPPGLDSKLDGKYWY